MEYDEGRGGWGTMAQKLRMDAMMADYTGGAAEEPSEADGEPARRRQRTDDGPAGADADAPASPERPLPEGYGTGALEEGGGGRGDDDEELPDAEEAAEATEAKEAS